MRGLVLKIAGSNVTVKLENGDTVFGKIRGNFRLKDIKSTNPIVVGDYVEINTNGFISQVAPRKNYIVRRPTNLSKQRHVIASNIDLALLVVTIKKPETSPIFIDRFLTTAKAYSIDTTLVFNKIDTLNSSDTKTLGSLKEIYKKIGYKTIECVASKGIGVEAILREIDGKTVLISGNSGVGKSTLINALVGKDIAPVGEISSYHNKGVHTTTFSQMYEINDTTHLIDTPGVKGFGLVDMDICEIGHYFVDIFETSKNCFYPNCTHIIEPNCAVVAAVAENKISTSRYNSYVSIINEMRNFNKYR